MLAKIISAVPTYVGKTLESFSPVMPQQETLKLHYCFSFSTFCLDAKSGAKKSRTNECLRPFVLAHAQVTPKFFQLYLGVRQVEDSASCYATPLEALYSVHEFDKFVMIAADGIRRWDSKQDKNLPKENSTIFKFSNSQISIL